MKTQVDGPCSMHGRKTGEGKIFLQLPNFNLNTNKMSIYNSLDERLKMTRGSTQHFDTDYKEVAYYDNHSEERQFNREKIGLVDVFIKDIIGTNHQRYTPGSWLNALNNAERFDSVVKFFAQKDPLYFKEGVFHWTNITLHKKGTNYFIYDGGNNRIILSRFFGIEKIKVNVEELIPK